jgi:hypothetical protein
LLRETLMREQQKYEKFSSRLLEKAHLPVTREGVEQAGVFEFVFAVGAQGDEFGKFEREEKIFDRLAGARALDEIAVGLRAADAVGEFVGVAQPAPHLGAVLTSRQFEGGVEVGGSDDFGAVFAFKNFEFHSATRLVAVTVFVSNNATKLNKLFFKNKLLLDFF